MLNMVALIQSSFTKKNKILMLHKFSTGSLKKGEIQADLNWKAPA